MKGLARKHILASALVNLPLVPQMTAWHKNRALTNWLQHLHVGPSVRPLKPGAIRQKGRTLAEGSGPVFGTSMRCSSHRGRPSDGDLRSNSEGVLPGGVARRLTRKSPDWQCDCWESPATKRDLYAPRASLRN